MMSKKERAGTRIDDAELEARIRADRKFSMAEAIARRAGSDLLKGGSPVTRKRQAELEIERALEIHLVDAEGALELVLLRRVSDSAILLEMDYDLPLLAMAKVIERILTSEARLEHFVTEVDREWGRISCERPHFQRAGQDADKEDPYTFASVRNLLMNLLDRLNGD